VSRKNTWRSSGRFQFRRESGRYSDGTLDGRDILYVRIKGVGCCFASTPYPENPKLGTAYNDGGLYFSADPVRAAKQFRFALLSKKESGQ
jgi:hypothetical protein